MCTKVSNCIKNDAKNCCFFKESSRYALYYSCYSLTLGYQNYT